MKFYQQPLIDGKTYHVYNRGNNSENIFSTQENYFYFLRKFNVFLSEYLKVFCYCLLPNHFHFLVRVNDEISDPKTMCEAFRKFFTAYAKAFNKQENRTGSLFQKNFKRIEVAEQKYLLNLICYIHANPKKHGISDNFIIYPHSSYQSILSTKPTKLLRSEILDLFDGAENYKDFHTREQNTDLISHLIIE